MVILCFFIVFIYSLGSLYFANIIYYLLFAKQVIGNRGKIYVVSNTPAKIFLLLFILWTTISTFIYWILSGAVDSRSIVQYIFTLQYFIFLVPLTFDTKVFEKSIYWFSLIYSAIIIGMFIYLTAITPGFSISLYKDNTTALKYIPGWPNTTPIPLLVALWMTFKYKKFLGAAIVFITAAMLTTSRGAYLGILMILVYFVLKKAMTKKIYIAWIIIALAVTAVIGFQWILSNPVLASRILRSFDREDIFKTTMAYVKLSPLMGYGGNTIDQLHNIIIDFKPLRNWNHTHNWFLETLLRYGLVGLVLFSGFLASLWIRIKDNDRKLMFAALVVLALFQTFMRDFSFLLFLLYLSSSTRLAYLDNPERKSEEDAWKESLSV